MTEWQTVIGLEVHAQLQTKTKLVCHCSTSFGAEPNANTCPVCLALPGALPALNAHAVELAVKAAHALDCDIQHESVFARKNYFYPDLPKGYQISQYEQPYAVGGHLDLASGKRVRLVRIHMEEDAGKNIHAGASHSLVDYNRACTPLIEIVSEPDLRSAEEATDYLKRLRAVLMALAVCDGNMEEGSFRCDVNISINRAGEAYGTRVELKNINSFKFITQAIAYEVDRQKELITGGGKVVQETRLFDSEAKVTRSMRSKEDAHDYRYFPDPDLPPLLIDAALIERIRKDAPELPHAKAARYVSVLGLPAYDAGVLTDDARIAAFFERVVALQADAKAASNWIMGEVLRSLGDNDAGSLKLQPEQLAELLALIKDGVISGKIAKEIFPDLLDGTAMPKAIVERKGLVQVSDTGAIEAAVQAVIAANAPNVEKYKAGNDKLIGFFVGQVMKAMGGKANPAVVNEILKKALT
jgi:aspartyl-tRNA(Asn)/glutamyl-tRNA(Gln) amidotransferase subunit B